MKATRACSVDGCDRALLVKGWCKAHYLRWYRTGKLGPGSVRVFNPGAICSAFGCGKRCKAKGYCATHYLRLRLYGDAEYVGTPAGEDHYKWTGEDATYAAVHQRLRKERGQASAHGCSHCDNRASQWAYDHRDVDERIGRDRGREMAYSLDPAHYIPLCASCHKKFDLANAPTARSKRG